MLVILEKLAHVIKKGQKTLVWLQGNGYSWQIICNFSKGRQLLWLLDSCPVHLSTFRRVVNSKRKHFLPGKQGQGRHKLFDGVAFLASVLITFKRKSILIGKMKTSWSIKSLTLCIWILIYMKVAHAEKNLLTFYVLLSLGRSYSYISSPYEMEERRFSGQNYLPWGCTQLSISCLLFKSNLNGAQHFSFY